MEPHWYLHIAGCLPTQQGQGRGGAVIKAGIARANHAGLSAYLETANEQNLAFYGALGFVINGEWTVMNKLRCWSMLHKPS